MRMGFKQTIFALGGLAITLWLSYFVSKPGLSYITSFAQALLAAYVISLSLLLMPGTSRNHEGQRPATEPLSPPSTAAGADSNQQTNNGAAAATSPASQPRSDNVAPSGTSSGETATNTKTKRSATMTESEARPFSQPEECKRIIKGLEHPSDTAFGRNKLSLLQSRANPNQRLVRAFGVDNGFTTIDELRRKDFKSHANSLLTKVQNKGWSDLVSKADMAADVYMEKYESPYMDAPPLPSCRLEAVVQIITMKVVCGAFLTVDYGLLSNEPMLRIAQGINTLWAESKNSATTESMGIKQFRRYFEQLEIYSEDPKENPLNVLLPAYETLWRVVIRCLVEVVFRPSADPEWLGAFKTFLNDPKESTFTSKAAGKDKGSVKNLVDEALRLYPPTRRIYRLYEMESTGKQELVAADIEKCHRRKSIWGHDSEKYRPGRWNSPTVKMREAFMPFGGGPWPCPAATTVGPKMIAIMVGAIASYVTARTWRMEIDGDELLDDTILKSDREATLHWNLHRKSDDE